MPISFSFADTFIILSALLIGPSAGALTAAGARATGLRAGTPVAVGTGDDFATPRNRSLELASGEWIVYVDADERVRDALTLARASAVNTRSP